MRKKLKILFIVTEDWYFYSHRMAVGKAALWNGYEVWLATRVKNHGDLISREGIHIVPLQEFNRKLENPFSEFRKFSELLKVLRRLQPDILHNVAMKPVVFGTLAAHIAGVPTIVNALAGMGFLFISSHPIIGLLRRLFILSLRFLMRSNRVGMIVQNETDRRLLISERITSEHRIALIRGSGVDPAIFRFEPEDATGLPNVILPSRMLIDKGVEQFVDAARFVNQKRRVANFVLVGQPDEDNPASIPRARLQAWHREGAVEWWGHKNAMPNVFAQSNIVCLPSYREGLPKVLVEAAACGRAIVTTDVPGCNDVVHHGANGLLVPPRSSRRLASAILKLISNPQLREKMGKNGRQRVLSNFSESAVTDDTLKFYDHMTCRAYNPCRFASSTENALLRSNAAEEPSV